MSQSALAIPNEPGANFRADVNIALQALASKSSGATAPSTTYPYQYWYDTTLNILKIRNSANSAWVIVGPIADSTQNVLYTNNTAQTYTDSTGQTGFGVATPGYKVDVLGDANVSGVLRVAGTAQTNAARSTVASATTTDLGLVNSSGITISGTTPITGFGTVAAGIVKFVTLSGAVPITYNATSMILPGGASITGAAGDTFVAESLGSGNWRVLNYQRATGQSLINSAFPGAEGTLASAATTDLGSTSVFDISITGTSSITSFGSSATIASPIYFVRFTGALTLTYNATSMILPGAANITTAAGDFAIMLYAGSGNWRCLAYIPGVILAPLNSPALTGNPTAPTQAASDASTKLATTAQAASQPGMAKAWVNFTVSGGVCTIQSAFNISSVTYNGTGDYTANYTSNFADTKYTPMVSTTGLVHPSAQVNYGAKTISSVDISAIFASTTAFNPTEVSLTIYR